MRRGGRILIILGLLLAIISGVGVFVILATAGSQEQAPIKRTKVVVAMQPIADRSEISADQVGLVDWPVLPDFPVPANTYSETQQVVGKLAVGRIGQGQPVLATNLIDKTEAKEKHSNAAFILEKGNVAVAVPLTLLTSVAYAVQTGDRVDLVATMTAQTADPSVKSAQQTSTQRTLQNLLVLQVGNWPNAACKTDACNSSSITFQVSEQDALVLKFIEQKADQFSLVLRPVNDSQLYNPEPVTADYVVKRFGFATPILLR